MNGELSLLAGCVVYTAPNWYLLSNAYLLYWIVQLPQLPDRPNPLGPR